MQSLTRLTTLAVVLIAFMTTQAHADEAKTAAKASPKAAEGEAKKESAPDAKVDGKKSGDAFPLSASASVSYGFNHANFVESNGDFGYQRMAAGISASYKIWKGLSASTGLNVQKTLATSFLNPGTASTTTRTPWEVSDVSLSLAYGNFYKIPVVGIGFSGSLAFGFPASKTSQSAGLIMSVSPGLSANWSAAGFSVGIGGGYTYFLNENPTVRINCDIAPYNCEVSGGDTANPNALHNIRGSLRLGYQIIKPLGVSARYSISNGYRAVKFEEDEFTSELAQTGNQKGLGRHGFSLALSYRPLPKTSISVSMSSGGRLYTNDNDAIRSPFFDTESQLHHRTSYGMSLSQRF